MNEKRLIEKIEQLFNKANKRWFSVADCGLSRGYSRAYFDHYRYLLPNFGIYDDTRSHRWFIDTFDEWISTPLDELEARWESLPVELREKIKTYWHYKDSQAELGPVIKEHISGYGVSARAG